MNYLLENHMKSTLIVLTLCLFAGSGVASEKRDLARQVVSATDLDATMRQAMDSMIPMLSQMITQSEPHAEEAQVREMLEETTKLMWETFPMAEIKETAVSVYEELFTLEELKDLLAFYQSPTGKTFAAKQPQLMKLTGEKMQPIMGAWFPKFQQQAAEMVEKRMTEKKK